MKELFRFIAACFLVAIFIYSLFVQHIDLLSNVYTDGYNDGHSQCAPKSGYIVPEEGLES